MLDQHPRARLSRHEAEPLFEAPPAPPTCSCPPDEAAEAELVAVLEAPRDRSRDSEDDYGARERRIYRLVDGLNLQADLALARRVAAARSTDPLVLALARLNPDRRGRIARYISSPRRRAAKAAGR